jgi:hypothetical protein
VHAVNLADKLAQVHRDNEGFRSLPVAAQEDAYRSLAETMLARAEEVREGAWATSLADSVSAHLPPGIVVFDVVCLGIGSFGTNRLAQYQLAALLLVMQRLRGGMSGGSLSARDSGNLNRSGGLCSMFDPVLTDVEKGAAALLGFTTPSDNTEGKWRMRRASTSGPDMCDNEHMIGALSERFGEGDISERISATTTGSSSSSSSTTTITSTTTSSTTSVRSSTATITTTATTSTHSTHSTDADNVNSADDANQAIWTLFYMPHCGRALINNVLWANWGPDLARLLLVGNSLDSIAAASFVPTTAYPALAAAIPHAVERVPDGLGRYMLAC